MDPRPIGVFDSGLGGLTAVAELRKILPHENIIYFGDTSRVPYGGRSPEILLRYARQDVRFCRSFDIKAVLVACGTVSTTALPVLQQENDIPMLGVVEPACRKAVQLTRSKKIGLIATAASVRSGMYEQTVRALDPDMTVFSQACPLFVPLVENGRYHAGDRLIELLAAEYLAPLKEAGIDTLIMGCTHYPLLSEVLAAEMGPDVALVNVSHEAVLTLRETLEAQALLSGEKHGEDKFYASDISGDFQRLAHDFLGSDIGTVGGVDINAY